MSISGKISKPRPIETLKHFLDSYLRNVKDENDIQDIVGHGLFELIEMYKYDYGSREDERKILTCMKKIHGEMFPRTNVDEFSNLMSMWLRDSINLPLVVKFFKKVRKELDEVY